MALVAALLAGLQTPRPYLSFLAPSLTDTRCLLAFGTPSPAQAQGRGPNCSVVLGPPVWPLLLSWGLRSAQRA